MGGRAVTGAGLVRTDRQGTPPIPILLGSGNDTHSKKVKAERESPPSLVGSASTYSSALTTSSHLFFYLIPLPANDLNLPAFLAILTQTAIRISAPHKRLSHRLEGQCAVLPTNSRRPNSLRKQFPPLLCYDDDLGPCVWPSAGDVNCQCVAFQHPFSLSQLPLSWRP